MGNEMNANAAAHELSGQVSMIGYCAALLACSSNSFLMFSTYGARATPWSVMMAAMSLLGVTSKA